MYLCLVAYDALVSTVVIVVKDVDGSDFRLYVVSLCRLWNVCDA